MHIRINTFLFKLLLYTKCNSTKCTSVDCFVYHTILTCFYEYNYYYKYYYYNKHFVLFVPSLYIIEFIVLFFPAAHDRIALQGSSHPCEGRLVVYHNNQWGLVCHHQWMPTNGEVVCKSLGCGGHVESGILNRNLPSLTKFWMNDIKCNGTEDKLWNCKFNGWGIAQCQLQNYVSVRCLGE